MVIITQKNSLAVKINSRLMNSNVFPQKLRQVSPKRIPYQSTDPEEKSLIRAIFGGLINIQH